MTGTASINHSHCGRRKWKACHHSAHRCTFKTPDVCGRLQCATTMEELQDETDQQHQEVVADQQKKGRAERNHEELAARLVAQRLEVLWRDLVECGVGLLELDAILSVKDLATGGILRSG